MTDKPIHLALLMSFKGSRISGAAALAVERVNADNSLLPGRRLAYSSADSACSAQQGLAKLGELLRGEDKISAVIGLQCCVRGDELPVWRAEYSTDKSRVHSCFVVKQREISSGEAPLSEVHWLPCLVMVGYLCSSRAQWRLTQAKGQH